jgi:WD40 repeat protein
MIDTVRFARFSLAFTCHEAGGGGGQCLAYSSAYQLIISGGKRGDICIFDLRQRKRLATSQAHDSHLRALCLDPSEKFYLTGSAEGNIKVTFRLIQPRRYNELIRLDLAFTRL